MESSLDKAKVIGFPALALTDHGVLRWEIQLMEVCEQKVIKSIVGNEAYVVNEEIGSGADGESWVGIKSMMCFGKE